MHSQTAFVVEWPFVRTVSEHFAPGPQMERCRIVIGSINKTSAHCNVGASASNAVAASFLSNAFACFRLAPDRFASFAEAMDSLRRRESEFELSEAARTRQFMEQYASDHCARLQQLGLEAKQTTQVATPNSKAHEQHTQCHALACA